MIKTYTPTYLGLPLIALLLATSILRAQDPDILNKLKIQVDGEVRAIAVDGPGNKIYLGGDFSSVGRTTPNAVVLSTTTGLPNPAFPTTDGSVQTSLPDGNGGYFIGGSFTKVGDKTRHYVAHVNASGQVTGWGEGLSLNGPVYAIDKDGADVYIGGDFTGFGSIQKTNGAALDIVSAKPFINFPAVQGTIYAVTPDGSGGWFIGGSFTKVGDKVRHNIAQITGTGAVTDFFNSQSLDGDVKALTLDNGNLYVGGSFHVFNKSDIANGARIDATGVGQVDLAASRVTGGQVKASVSDGAGGYYIAGNFTEVGGQVRKALARIDNTGAVTSFFENQSIGGSVNAIAKDGNTLYIGGDFVGVGTEVNAHAAVIDASGTVSPLIPSFASVMTSAISDGSGGWYVAGFFNSIGSETRNNLARINAAGQVTEFFAGQKINVAPNTMTLSGGKLYIAGSFNYFNHISGTSASQVVNDNEVSDNYPKVVGTVNATVSDGEGGWYLGGSFTGVGGLARNGLAHINASGSVTSFFDGQTMDGTVNAMALNGNDLYIGGDFTGFNRVTGTGGSQIDELGIVNNLYPKVNSSISVAAPDGEGGWYIGGNFTFVGNQKRRNLAHILADGTVADWNPMGENSGVILSIAVSGEVVYVGGNFSFIGGQSRQYIAAIDAETGAATAWNANANSNVRGIAVSGSTVYVAGDFNNIGGQVRNYLAAIDATSGLATSWNPTPNIPANSVEVGDDVVYVAGSFTMIGGQNRHNLAAIDKITGLATSWNPNPAGGSPSVQALALGDGVVYVGGDYTSIGGQSHNHLAAIDEATGLATSWNPDPVPHVTPNNVITSIRLSGSAIYVSGRFNFIGGRARHFLASVDATNGLALPWNPGANDVVYALGISGTKIYAGGTFTKLGGSSRNRIASLNAVTGEVSAWDPGANNAVISLAATGSSIYAGGTFTHIGGQDRNRIAELDAETGEATSWNPNASDVVSALAISGNLIYVGGEFVTLSGLGRNRLACVDRTTGIPIAFDGGSVGRINTLAISGSTLYAGGTFTFIGGSPRNYIAALDVTTAVASSWNPNASNEVKSIAVSGSTVYAGGSFLSIGGKSRSNAAALDATTGLATAWEGGGIDAAVNALAAFDNKIFLGGTFTSIGGAARRGLASLDATTGAVSTWNPEPIGQFGQATVSSIAVSGSIVYVGGDFTSIGGQARNRIASLDATTGLATSWNPNSNGSVYAVAISGANIYAGGSFATIGGQTRANLAALDASTGLASSWNPGPNSPVTTIAIDGSTAYVAGSFTTVGGQSRNSIAALSLSTGLASSWNPNPTGNVSNIVVAPSGVYVAGGFGAIGGASRYKLAALDPSTGLALGWSPGFTTGPFFTGSIFLAGNGSSFLVGGDIGKFTGQGRRHIVAIDATTGVVTSWNPSADNPVLAVTVSGSTVYAGGSFANIGGQARNRIAALSTTTGLASSWNPNANDDVRVIIVSGATVYAGGSFTTIGGQTRNRIAALSSSTGLASSWNPNASSTVNSLLVSGSTVYVGGFFTTIGGQSRASLAALDATTGLASSFNANIGASFGNVNAMALSGSTLYIAGDFFSAGGQQRSGFAALNTSTALALDWRPRGTNFPLSLTLSGSSVYVGGSLYGIGDQSRNKLAALDAATGLVTSWEPNTVGPPNESINSIAVSGSVVYAGGNFSLIGGVARNNLVALSAATGAVTAWAPNPNGTIQAIAVSAGNVYVGGSYSSIGGQSRSRLASVSESTGLATAWNPAPNNSVQSISISGSTVYVGGNFTSIGGQARNRLAAIDATAGTASAWNPNANGGVTTILPSGSNVYVGGTFTDIGGKSRSMLAALDATSGQATAWTPALNNTVWGIAIQGNVLYAGGSFSSAGMSRSRLAALSASTGLPTAWNPGVSSTVRCIKVVDNLVYIGGAFQTVGIQNKTAIAAIDRVTGIATPWGTTGTSTFGAVQIVSFEIYGTSIYVGGNFNNLGGQTRNNLAALDLVTGLATAWNPAPNNSFATNVVKLYGNSLVVGADFTTIGGQNRKGVAVVDLTTGLATDWNANVTSGFVSTILTSGNTFYLGGNFSSIGGESRNNLAAVDAVSGLLSPWNPAPNSIVMTLCAAGDAVFAGGSFTTVGGNNVRNRIACIDATTGEVSGWNPGADATVFALAIIGSEVYAGGSFQLIGGQARNRIAALDVNTGLATPWNPNANSTVRALTTSGNIVFAGGDFGVIGGKISGNVAALDANSGVCIPTWGNGGGNNSVNALAIHGTTLYVGGSFTSMGGAVVSNLAALDMTTATPKAWRPQPDAEVKALAIVGSSVIAGGTFSAVGGFLRTGIAAIDAQSGVATGWNARLYNPSGGSSSSINALFASGNTIYAAGSFTVIGGQNRNFIAALDATNSLAVNWNPGVNNASVYALATTSNTLLVGGYFGTLNGQLQSNFGGLSVPDPNSDIGIFAPDGLSIPNGGIYNFGWLDLLANATSGSLTFKVKNAGASNLTLTAPLLLSGPQSSDYAFTQPATTISPGSEAIFTVSFTPSIGGLRKAQVTIASTDPDESPFTFKLQGVGVGLDQTIDFDPLGNATYGDAVITLTGFASSALPITYSSSDNNVLTIVDDEVTIVNSGTATITAKQEGSISYNPAEEVSQVLVVNKAELTANADDKSRPYGDANPALTLAYSGFKNDDDGNDIDTPPTLSSTAVAASNTGVYPISLAGGSDNNYTFVLVDGELSVTKSALSVVADDKSSVYGDELPVLTFSYNGLKGTDDATSVDEAPGISTSAVATSNAGTYPISLAGGTDSNYELNLTTGTLTITKASLVAKPDDKTKVFGDQTPSLSIGYTGFKGADDATSIDTPPAIATTATTSSDVGTYPISATGGADNNYEFTLTTGTLTVSKASLVAKADDKSKTYGDAVPTLTITYTGFKGADNAGVLDTSPTLTTTATASATVGSYPITLTGGLDNNYALSVTNGSLNVSKAPLKATADSKTMSYGSALPALTITYTGLKGTDNAGVIDTPPGISTTATSTSTAGTYPITLLGGTDDNYDLNELVDGILAVVGKISQTVAFGTLSDKTLGDPAFSLSATSTSGLSVVFTSTSDKVTISGNTATLANAGRATISAGQPGNAVYEAAASVERSFCINPAKPTVAIDQSNPEATLLTSGSPVGNQWYRNGDAIAGATSTTFTVLSQGLYTLKVRIDDCESEASGVILIIVTGIDGTKEESVSLFPNPATDVLNVRLPVEGGRTIRMVHTDGRVVAEVIATTPELQLDISSYPSGMYFVFVSGDNNVHRFVKQ